MWKNTHPPRMALRTDRPDQHEKAYAGMREKKRDECQATPAVFDTNVPTFESHAAKTPARALKQRNHDGIIIIMPKQKLWCKVTTNG